MKKANITQEKHKACLALYREGLNRWKQGNSVEPPYFVYYVCRSDETERLDNPTDKRMYWEVDRDAEAEQEREGEEEPKPSDEYEHDAMTNAEKDEEQVDTAASDSSDNEREDDTETETEQNRRKIDRKESTEET